jgi:hypothetical protein
MALAQSYEVAVVVDNRAPSYGRSFLCWLTIERALLGYTPLVRPSSRIVSTRRQGPDLGA